MAFRRQTQEAGTLQQQMKEQQDVLAREARECHRAQASRVFISLAIPQRGPAHFNVVNTSDQPVYDAEIQWRDNDAIGPPGSPRPRAAIAPAPEPVFEGLVLDAAAARKAARDAAHQATPEAAAWRALSNR